MDDFQQGLFDLAQYNVKRAEDLYSQNLKNVADTNRIFMFIIILSILLGIILTYIISKPIIASLKAATICFNAVGSGDFTSVLPDSVLKSKDEIGDMTRAISKMQKSIKEVIKGVIDETSYVNKMVDISIKNISKLNTDIQDVFSTTEQLSAGMEETAASAEEMNATSADIETAIDSIS
jgi:methyl-accepting chemotaxis protein